MKQLKKIACMLMLALAFASCMTTIPLKGTYSDSGYTIESNKTIDEVWTNIIDLFAQKGFSIKIIDKASGLITSDKVSFIKSYTFENVQGSPIDPNAYVVLEKTNMITKASLVVGEWNIRIKQSSKNTIININLINIIGTIYVKNAYGQIQKEILVSGKNTNVFEKYISEKIK